MSRCKLSHLLSFLKENGLKPKKALSQNFLVDENIVQKIIQQLELEKGDHVLEIGPGAGALTEKLCNYSIHLTCVEKDHDLASLLSFSEVKAQSFQILNLDINHFSFRHNSDITDWKIISNLPYHITSKILKNLAAERQFLKKCVIMVEKGYADDLIKAKPLQAYDATSFILHHSFELKVLFQVSKHCFFPQPKIDSTVMLLQPKPIREKEGEFISFLEILFSQKRKMIQSILKNCFSINSINEQSKVNAILTLRPELLNHDQAYELFSVFYQEINPIIQAKEAKNHRHKMHFDELQDR